MAQEGLEVMLCMPTIGHYLASTQYDNVIAVRTSTDYVNHQRGQVAMLHHLEEFQRALNSPQRNLRQNLLLSFLAWAVGLAPSYDVFITNQHHSEGFAEPDAPRQALAGRSPLVSSVLAISWTRWTGRWSAASLFPMGHWPNRTTPHPVVTTLQSDATAFYTTTSISGYRWTYVALFNLAEDTREYQLDLRPFLRGAESVVYDYRAKEQVAESQLLSGLAGEPVWRVPVLGHSAPGKRVVPPGLSGQICHDVRSPGPEGGYGSGRRYPRDGSAVADALTPLPSSRQATDSVPP